MFPVMWTFWGFSNSVWIYETRKGGDMSESSAKNKERESSDKSKERESSVKSKKWESSVRDLTAQELSAKNSQVFSDQNSQVFPEQNA